MVITNKAKTAESYVPGPQTPLALDFQIQLHQNDEAYQVSSLSSLSEWIHILSSHYQVDLLAEVGQCIAV